MLESLNEIPMLLSLGSIGKSRKLKNRIVMSAMWDESSDDGFVNDAVIEHYCLPEPEAWRRTLLCVEVTCVGCTSGEKYRNSLILDDDKYIPGMQRLTDAIHAEGAKCFLK